MNWRDRWLQFTCDNTEIPLSLDGYRAKLFWSNLHASFDAHMMKTHKKKVANHPTRYN